jgi:PQQ-like domain
MKIPFAGGLLVLISEFAAAQATFHGNVSRTGVYESAGPKTFGGIKWTFKTSGPIVASPAIADGVVYIPSMDTNLYAIDQETGKEKWKYKSRMPHRVISGDFGRHALFCFVRRGTWRTRHCDRKDQMGVADRI